MAPGIYCTQLQHINNLTFPQFVKKFPAICGTQRFVTVPTKSQNFSHHQPLRSTPHLTILQVFLLRFILILSPINVCIFQVVLFPSGLPIKSLYRFFLFPHPCYAPRPSWNIIWNSILYSIKFNNNYIICHHRNVFPLPATSISRTAWYTQRVR